MEESWWKDITDLDKDQKAIIALPADGNFLVKGPPGSGKTNLLLLRANYFAVSGKPNIAIIVFNRTLKEFLAYGASRYDFDSNCVKTSFSLFKRLLGEAGVKLEEGNFQEKREDYIKEMLKIQKAPIYDCLFLDQSQDYLPEEIEIFRRLGEQVFLVADSRQSIYMDCDLSHLEKAVDETHEIKSHYRTGARICELADRVGSKFTTRYDKTLPDCNYKDSTPATFDVFKGNLDAQIIEAANRLKEQRRLYPKSILGVLTPSTSDIKLIAEGLSKQGLGDLLCVQSSEEGYQPINASKPIWISNIHSAKGLEFRALHLLAMEKIVSVGRDKQKRLTFTAITRARTSLVIYHDKSLPDYLAGAIAEMSAPPPAQPLEAAFGKRS